MPNTAYSASQKKRRIKNLLNVLCIFLVLLIDQVSKAIISSKLSLGQSIPIIRRVWHITSVRNTGAAFGLFKNSTYFFIAVSILAIIIIGTVLIKSIRNKGLLNIGLILIMSGALGNLIDRVRLGYVVDFIDLRVWPVFNIADSAITIGTILLIFSFIKPNPKNLTENKTCDIL